MECRKNLTKDVEFFKIIGIIIPQIFKNNQIQGYKADKFPCDCISQHGTFPCECISQHVKFPCCITQWGIFLCNIRGKSIPTVGYNAAKCASFSDTTRTNYVQKQATIFC